MKTKYQIKIGGNGTSEEIAKALKQLAGDIELGLHVDSVNERGECEWEDSCIFTEITEEVDDEIEEPVVLILEGEESTKFARICSVCMKGMNEGYCFDNGRDYYCSDECLHTVLTEEEWNELHDSGSGDSYWTEWDPADNDEDEE